MAVPFMLIVAPSEITKAATEFDTPRLRSAQRKVTGKVALELAVE